jgi:hypothetical protein
MKEDKRLIHMLMKRDKVHTLDGTNNMINNMMSNKQRPHLGRVLNGYDRIVCTVVFMPYLSKFGLLKVQDSKDFWKLY